MQTFLNGLPTSSRHKAFSENWILLWQSIDTFTTQEANHLFRILQYVSASSRKHGVNGAYKYLSEAYWNNAVWFLQR